MMLAPVMFARPALPRWSLVTSSVTRHLSLLLLFAFILHPSAFPQDAPRPSLAGPDAAQARRISNSLLDASNLKLGPSSWRFAAALAVQSCDNLRGDSAHPQADVSFRPELDASMRLPLSQRHTLAFSLDAGYAFYLRHTEYDRPFINPGSQFSFDLYAPNCWLNLHDRFALADTGWLDPTVTAFADYERLDNTAGLSATCDLNKVVASLSYDHQTYNSLGNTTAGATDGSSEVFALSAGYTLRPGLLAGIEVGGGLLHYSAAANDGLFSEGNQWSMGGFVYQKVTQYIESRASAGYTSFQPGSGLAAILGQKFSGFYAQLSATHRLNQFVEYTLTGGRLLNFGFFGGLFEQYFVTLNADWRILRKTTLATGFNYQHGSQLGAASETFDWFGPRVELSRRLTARLSGSFAYQYYWRGSDLPGRDYAINLASASVLYEF